MRRAAAVFLVLAMPVLALAGPSQAQIDDAVKLGTIATMAQMCRVRTESWGADLRRSTIQGATGTPAFDDAGLKAAPGSDLVIGALSFAEAEALEDFAVDPAPVTCGPLLKDPLLRRADEMVRRFRAGMPGS